MVIVRLEDCGEVPSKRFTLIPSIGIVFTIIPFI
jgi:hypothetical protein